MGSEERQEAPERRAVYGLFLRVMLSEGTHSNITPYGYAQEILMYGYCPPRRDSFNFATGYFNGTLVDPAGIRDMQL